MREPQAGGDRLRAGGHWAYAAASRLRAAQTVDPMPSGAHQGPRDTRRATDDHPKAEHDAAGQIQHRRKRPRGGRAPADVSAERVVKRAAVLGAPIAHSLSPVLHRAAYAELGLEWTYDAVECSPERLPGLLDELDESWVGLSLTMPLKRTVLPLLDDVSPLAAAVGAANTVIFGGRRRQGDNTDVGGFLDTLAGHGMHRPRSAIVLGAGATASSALAGLSELGLGEASVVVRDPARTRDLRAAAERLGVGAHVRTFADLPELLPVDLLVSTLPSGAADGVADVFASGGRGRTPGTWSSMIVLDVCYDPWPTRLASAAEAAGQRVAGGFDLLLYQAVRQVRLMTGLRDIPVEAMRAAGGRALGDRAAGQ